VRILVLARRWAADCPAGLETALDALVARARASAEVRLVAGFTRNADLLPPDAVAVDQRSPSAAARAAALARVAAAEAARWRPDLILTTAPLLPPLPAPVAAVLLGPESWSLPPAPRPLRAAATAALLRRPALLLCPTAAAARALESAGAPPGRVRVVPFGVDAARFAPGPPRPAGGPFTFVLPARIHPSRGQHLAIDAVARLRAGRKARASLLIAGAPEDRVYLDQLRVQAWGQPVRFHLDGGDPAALLRGGDAVVLPALAPEAWSFTLLEGMATGLPPVWSDQPALREATGGKGLPVQPGDADALRVAFERLMDDPAAAAALGAEARAFTLTHRRWDRAWDAILPQLQALVRRAA
jgi:glycosyltransferase involved in cell wall biosynthesis